MKSRDTLLDAWRGVAVLLVILFHTGSHFHWTAIKPWDAYGGWLGVTIFFVISGYIITKLLIEEPAPISLRGFYLRRACRILPPLGLLLLFAGALDLAGVVQVGQPSFLRGALFLCNLEPTCDDPIAHLWTLGIEEQFYLLWPLAVVAIPRRYLALTAAALLVGLSFAPRLDPAHFAHRNTLAVASLAAGTLYASSPRVRRWIAEAPRIVIWLAWGFLWLNLALPGPILVQVIRLFMPAAVPVSAMICVFSVYRLDVQDNWLVRGLAKVGLVSYGLYLYHQPLVVTRATGFEWLFIPMAILSYRWIELPTIAWGRRLLARRTLVGATA